MTHDKEMEMAMVKANTATSTFRETQKLVNNEFVKVVEKVALYSAGIISLSITFIGTIISDRGDLLRSPIFCVPILYYLFTA